MIRVDNLWKSFGRQEVLRGVSFEVQPGETYNAVRAEFVAFYQPRQK